jgi:hypothetical protein
VFDPFKYKFFCVYRKNIHYCEFNISLYNDNNQFIVEGYRIDGDARTYYSFYNNIKAVFSDDKNNTDLNSHQNNSIKTQKNNEHINDDLNINLNVDHDDDWLNDVNEGFKQIYTIIKDDSPEAQEIAAHTLCHLSVNDKMHNPICKAGFIPILVKYANLEDIFYDHVKNLAILALANISKSIDYHKLMIDDGVVFLMLKWAVDGEYQIREICRAAGRTLANIASTSADIFFSQVDLDKLLEWIHSTDNIKDPVLKQSTDTIKEYLRPFI